MSKFRLIVSLTLISLAGLSCDDEIFGPRTFEGEWKATEYDDEFNELRFMAVTNYYPDDSSRLLISNFSSLGLEYDVVANISGLNLTIIEQSVDGRGGTFRISGSGKATSNIRKIDWIYKVDGDDFTAVFEKQ